MSARQMLSVWDGLVGLYDAQSVAAENRETAANLSSLAATMRQRAAAVRWVQHHHGPELADAFTAYLSNASNQRGAGATAP